MKIKIYKRDFLGESHTIYMNDEKHPHLMVDADKVCKYDLALFKFRVRNAVSDWPTELKDERVIDGLEYEIVLERPGEPEKKYLFKNKFPDDIWRIESIIEDVLGVENGQSVQ